MSATHLHGLYAITASQLLSEGRLLPWCEAALSGGVRLLQFRDKSRDHQRRRQEAGQLLELCRQYNARLIINDDLELAAALGCDLHLGQEDGSLALARQRLGTAAIIGATCHHHLSLAQQAVNEGASYVAFGRFYSSQTKPGEVLAQPELIRQAQHLATPVVAIGGITPANASPLIQAGAAMTAGSHALFAADSPAEVQRRAQAFSQLFYSAKPI